MSLRWRLAKSALTEEWFILACSRGHAFEATGEKVGVPCPGPDCGRPLMISQPPLLADDTTEGRARQRCRPAPTEPDRSVPDNADRLPYFVAGLVILIALVVTLTMLVGGEAERPAPRPGCVWVDLDPGKGMDPALMCEQ